MTDAIKGIRGSHVALTPLAASDLPVLLGWINERSNVLLNAPFRPVTEAQHRAWLESLQDRDDCVVFGIRRLEGGALIGSCQLYRIRPVHRTAELQIRLGERDARGHGYGTEAIALLVEFAFSVGCVLARGIRDHHPYRDRRRVYVSEFF